MSSQRRQRLGEDRMTHVSSQELRNLVCSQGCSELIPRRNQMRKTPILTFALLSAIMIPAIQQVHASPQTIDGVVRDSMCGKEHMLAGKTAAECIHVCLK